MLLSDISQRVAKVVCSLIDPDQTHGGVKGDFVLSEEGNFDSVLVLRLVIELEKEFPIAVDDEEVTPDNFHDLPSLTKFVARKLSASDGLSG